MRSVVEGGHLEIGTYDDGRALVWDSTSSMLSSGASPVSPADAVIHEGAGQLTMVSSEWRDWLYRFAGAAPQHQSPVEAGLDVSAASTKVITRRAVALLIDGIFINVALMPVFITLNILAPTETAYNLIAYPLNFIAIAAYRILCDVRFGRSVGKLPFGLRVVSQTGGRITYRQAVTRFAGTFLDMMVFGLPAILSMNATQLHQRLGDRMAGTYVVKGSAGA